MRNIVYKSENLIPWDTQSAFKMTSYKASSEDNMVFCYLKAFVHGGDLVFCSYCFTENPHGTDTLQLYVNLNPEKSTDILKISFGYDGTGIAECGGKDCSDRIVFHPFKSDDEQGFYWCGEIRLKKELIRHIYGCELLEKSIFTLNMVQSFDNGDISVLFGNAEAAKYCPAENMETFTILDY